MSGITITRPQREAIYQDLVTQLSAVGDIHLALQRGDVELARRYRRECEGLMRLLDDVGWAWDAPGDEFELSMDDEQLAEVVARLHTEAAGGLAAHVRRPREDDEAAERQLAACEAYAGVLASLARG